MKDTYYLVFNRSGVDRMTKNPPTALKATERCVEMKFEVDDAVFTPFQIPKVSVRVPAEAVSRQFEAVVESELKV